MELPRVVPRAVPAYMQRRAAGRRFARTAAPRDGAACLAVTVKERGVRVL